jgi:hypothetical protein
MQVKSFSSLPLPFQIGFVPLRDCHPIITVLSYPELQIEENQFWKTVIQFLSALCITRRTLASQFTFGAHLSLCLS